MNNDGVLSCCSDYAQNFLALAQAVGLFAREVRIASHVFAEVYDPKGKRWIWVDPQLGALAEKEGKPLSLLELREAVLNGGFFVFRDLRRGDRYSYGKMPEWMAPFYKRDNFKTIRMLMGNNLYSEYAFEERISFLPKAIRQLLSYAAGVKPRTLIFKEV